MDEHDKAVSKYSMPHITLQKHTLLDSTKKDSVKNNAVEHWPTINQINAALDKLDRDEEDITTLSKPSFTKDMDNGALSMKHQVCTFTVASVQDSPESTCDNLSHSHCNKYNKSLSLNTERVMKNIQGKA